MRRLLAALLSLAPLTACSLGDPPTAVVIVTDGRIQARPGTPTKTVAKGLTPLGLAQGRDGQLFVPSGYDPAVRTPLVVLFHGAGRDGSEMIEAMREAADSETVILVAPDSRSRTWDLVTHGVLGVDLVFTNLALLYAFDRLNVDPARIGLAGFSDGASYALTVGRTNGDLFTRVAVFSPGFLGAAEPTGKPEFFITHGTNDNVLAAGQTRLYIVPGLREQGYTVTYTEFPGGHGVTKALIAQATDWLAAPRPAPSGP